VIWRGATLGFTAIGVIFLALACYLYQRNSDNAYLVVEERDREITSPGANGTIEVSFRVYNPSRRTIRVVGLAFC
jgi:hypothetical protein